MTDSRGYMFISIPILGWGLAPIIVDLGLEYINVLTFFAYRFIVAWIITTPIVLMTRWGRIKELLDTRWTLYVGLAHILALFSQYVSQLFISPSISSTISYSYLIIVPFVSVALLGKRVEKFHFAIVTAAIAGAVLMVTQGDLSKLAVDIRGITFALLSTLGFALYIVSTSRLVTREKEDVDSFSLFYLIITIVSITSLITSFITGAPLNPTSIDARGWLYIVMLAVLSTIIAYTAYIQSLKYLSPNFASVLLLLQIVIPYVLEFFAFGVSYSAWVLAGGAIIVTASATLIMKSDDSLH